MTLPNKLYRVPGYQARVIFYDYSKRAAKSSLAIIYTARGFMNAAKISLNSKPDTAIQPKP